VYFVRVCNACRDKENKRYVKYLRQQMTSIECGSEICGNKMPTTCNRGFYCRSYCLLNMFRASPCPSPGAQELYTVVAACGILCCGFSSSWSGVKLRVMRPLLHLVGILFPHINDDARSK